MDKLRQHRDYLEGEWLSLKARPLSARQAMLVAALVDAYVDRLFAADAEADDILTYRAAMGTTYPALGLILALWARRPDIALVTEAVAVPIADYGRLSVEDFMVSLYNDHSVQRVLLALPDGTRRDMLETLREAIAALDMP